MSTYSAEAENALAFARQHDWGTNAKLACYTVGGTAYVTGIRGYRYDADGKAVPNDDITVLATVKALREFGEY